MNNPPSKEELITSVIEFIENDIIDELVGQKRFHAHVAKNSLQIILRQLKLEEKNNRFEKNRLKEILKIDGFLNMEKTRAEIPCLEQSSRIQNH